MRDWQDRIELSPEEEELARQIGFAEGVLRLLKKQDVDELRRLTVQGFDAQGFSIEVPAQGVAFAAYRLRAEQLVRRLCPKLQPWGYWSFLPALGLDDRPDTVAVVKGRDQYDILRVMKTCDLNGDKSTEDVIGKLKEWEARHPFDFIGAGFDWVHAKFRKLPEDLEVFASEVTAFSDDFSQGDWESLEDFTRAMRRSKTFDLWWD
jgi:hypothetical protein